ncbi:MAG TPA: tRNA epoxyqueuosine(34) reductase QueG [Acidobacteriaceae bacterium]|nr:tRNA epoxyqueuosine(34) reductase QueG [Acidobacteriaceae bacterium]
MESEPCAKARRDSAELSYLEPWIAEGRAGEMEYLKRRDADGRLLRSSVQVPFPWVRSVIVCGVNYNCDQPYSIDLQTDSTAGNRGWIARYAWSGQQTADAEQGTGGAANGGRSPTDYHKVIRGRLEHLCDELKRRVGEFESRCFVDTGPLVERVYAKYAGLGWQGKNTCLIHERLGSWFFLGVILTSLDLPREERAQPMPDRCGSCTRCIDACPTEALEPYRMDASRCIAYLTIEKRGPITEELAAKTGRNVFGCDICQEVCPWNRRVPVTDWPELQPRPELVNPALDWLASFGDADYRRIFHGSPVDRAKFKDFQRNVALAQENAACRPDSVSTTPALEKTQQRDVASADS